MKDIKSPQSISHTWEHKVEALLWKNYVHIIMIAVIVLLL